MFDKEHINYHEEVQKATVDQIRAYEYLTQELAQSAMMEIVNMIGEKEIQFSEVITDNFAKFPSI